MKIISVPGVRIQLDKRQNVPYKITDDCPKCGLAHLVDLTRDGGKYGRYLSYPEIGQPCKIYFVCEKCETEWQPQVIVRLTLEEAP